MKPRALTIAGSDPGGGAGIEQDLKTFQALGAWGMAAITAVTVQDTVRVYGWHAVPPDTIAAQITAVAEDIGVDAAKTGMLPNADSVRAVARVLRERGIPLVVDPVMVATSGDSLSDDDAIAALRELLPLATLVTPNADEAEVLFGAPVRSRAAQADAARAIVGLGARAALVTGGHLEGDEVVDVLVDAEGETEFRGQRRASVAVHGSGCMLSAAITAHLAAGRSLRDAVADAKRLVGEAIERAERMGAGALPVDPAWTP